VGISATRLLSVLYSGTLNAGRVQTPTLAMIADRENEIARFVKEPFYTVELDCNGVILSSERIKEKSTAEQICEVCGGKTARIISAEHHKKSVSPPLLYDLTALQREANRIYGFTSQQTLDYAQNLYEKSYISYPRSDSRFLTEDTAEELPELIHDAAALLNIKEVKIGGIAQVIDNSKVSDHTAVIPTKSVTAADLRGLPAGERTILEMVGIRLICAVGEKHIYNEDIITAECENHLFTAKGKTVLQNGWKSFSRTVNDEKDTVLPEFPQGHTFENVTAGIHEGFTSPPEHFTEDTLLSAMENAGDFSEIPNAARKGLGTPATRAAIIEKLIKSGYIERREAKKVRHLLPAEKGFALIKAAPEVLKSAELTADWEYKLHQIEKGELSDDIFMAEIAGFTRDMVKSNRTANAEFTKKVYKNVIGTCPRCGKDVCESKKGFFCENSKVCGFALWRGNKYFTLKGREITRETAAALLADGRIHFDDLISSTTGAKYAATIIMKPNKTGFVSFDLEFDKSKKL
jgi:DNA topoisomerase-3